jgi:hypothetical protein
VKGFIDEDHISFTNIYPKYYILDESGDESIEQDASGLSVTYEGKFDMQNKCFTGS